MRISDWSSDVCSSDLMVQIIRHEYGLDRSLPEQYIAYLGGILHGDFGRSIVSTEPVLKELLRYFPATIELVLVAMALSTSSMVRSEEHTSELQSLMRISYAVFCLKKKINIHS